MATATCGGPSSRRAPPSTRGGECFGNGRVWHRPAGGPCFATVPARPTRTAAPAAGSAASAAGGERRWPQMWRVWPRYFALGQSPRAPVHGEPGPFFPMHAVHEDLQPSHGSSRASVRAGRAEAVCVWRVQDGLLAPHVVGAASQRAQHRKQSHEVLHL